MAYEAVSPRISAAWTRLQGSRAAVEAGAPWPLAERFDDAPEASWGPPEVLAHLEEMVGFWTGEFRRVALGSPDGSPVAFGRTAADPGRLGAIERDRHLAPAALYERLERALDALASAWSGWTAEERERVGVHPRWGEMTISAAVDRFISGHLADHAAQLEAALGTEPPAG